MQEGSTSRVVDGKHYNGVVRAHKYVHEALAWAEFIQWLEASNPDQRSSVTSFLELLSKMTSDVSQESSDNLL